MSQPGSKLPRLAALGAVALLTACTVIGPESQASPTAAFRLPGTPTHLTPAAEPSVPVSGSANAARAVAPAQSQPSVTSSPGTAPRASTDPAARQALRLPEAEDLGPNYFELFSGTSAASPGNRPSGRVAAAVVAFGFSERAKLRDERIKRDGPLAAVARVSRHASNESAVRFAAASGRASGPDMAVTDGSANWLELAAELRQSQSSAHELAPDFTATRTLQTGWFAALDGSRVPTVVEQWTALRERTVLTVVLIWDNQVTDGWGRSLIQRLTRTAGAQAQTHGP